MCIVLEGMKKDPDFEKDFKVHVKRVGNQESNQQISQDPSIYYYPEMRS